MVLFLYNEVYAGNSAFSTGRGGVASVSLVTANGFSGSVANSTTTPAITLSTNITGILKGNGTAMSAAVAGTDYEVPLTFSTGLTRATNTVTVNTTQNIARLSNFTSNGFVKTSGGDGTLSVDTNTYLTGNQTITLSGDLTGSGATAITGTLATVNSNVGSFTCADVTVNAKGLVTAAANGTCGGGGGATTALDNLASVAINTALLPATTSVTDLGSSTKAWNDLFLGGSGAKIDIGSNFAITYQSGSSLRFSSSSGNPVVFDIGTIRPLSDNTTVLGVASVGFADLFMGSGAVIGFNNGDVTLTHSTNLLTVAGGDLAVPMGASSSAATVGGKANVNTTAVGNVGAGTDDLITYTLPANSLSANGKGVRITAWGTTANNANSKTLTLNFGSTAILTNSLTTSIAGVWRIEAEVFRTGASTQDYSSQLVTTGTAGVALNDLEIGTSAQTDSSNITIKCTGAATSDNDIVQEGMLVEMIN